MVQVGLKDVHATAFIGEGVTIGDDVKIGPFAVVLGRCTIGPGTWIGPGVKIGSPPEISSLRHNTAWSGDLDHAGVVIGRDVVLRENVVIHQGSRRATRIDDGAWVLNSAYLAHDTHTGARATVSAGVTVGGHAEIGAGANIGMNATIHQHRVIGAGAMVGMATPVARDIPPFAKVFGTPPRLRGVNRIGMQRLGIDDDAISTLDAAYVTGEDLARVAARAEWAAYRRYLDAWIERSDLIPVRPAGGPHA